MLSEHFDMGMEDGKYSRPHQSFRNGVWQEHYDRGYLQGMEMTRQIQQLVLAGRPPC